MSHRGFVIGGGWPARSIVEAEVEVGDEEVKVEVEVKVDGGGVGWVRQPHVTYLGMARRARRVWQAEPGTYEYEHNAERPKERQAATFGHTCIYRRIGSF